MADLSAMPSAELLEGYREYAREVQYRAERTRVPEQLRELAEQGRSLGLSEDQILGAVKDTRPEEPAPEEGSPEGPPENA